MKEGIKDKSSEAVEKSRVEEEMDFIRNVLLPEMVHDRCFCEASSREYVELESSEVRSCRKNPGDLDYYASYRGRVVVRFSGEPTTFHVLIKLLPESASLTSEPDVAQAYAGFLNEEIMWNKGSRIYGRDLFPKFYLADMGRYGRPAIVLDDLQELGFETVVDRELSLREAGLVMQTLGKFHGKGVALKRDEFSAFRELYSKLNETVFTRRLHMQTKEKASRLLKHVEAESIINIFEKFFDDEYFANCKDTLLTSICKDSSTICQGLLLPENLWFKEIDGENMELRIMDWQRVKYCSNSIDLATILPQCNANHWDDLIKIYLSTLCAQGFTDYDDKQLRQEINNIGFVYAFIIYSSESIHLRKFTNILSSAVL